MAQNQNDLFFSVTDLAWGMFPTLSFPLLLTVLSLHSLAQYATLANHLSTSPKLKDRPIIILIQPSISMSFFDAEYLHPPDKKSLTRDLVEVAKVHSSIFWVVRSWARELNILLFVEMEI